jgi:hypothetical protein
MTMLTDCLRLGGRYTERTPRPANPIHRPTYQGSNPVADIFSLWALKATVEHLPRVSQNPDDFEARKQMLYVQIVLSFHSLISSSQARFLFRRNRIRKRRRAPVPRNELSSRGSRASQSIGLIRTPL